MRTLRHINHTQTIIRKLKAKHQTVGFVPTMGFLHDGHLSLIRRSKKENDITVLSIYVNPTQFAPGEDLARYPRNIRRDRTLARKEGVDILFCPNDKIMYPEGFQISVDAGPLARRLCGMFRPGHFQGVTTVVAKLLNIITPDTLYLGQKDAQQAVIIKQMIRDLNFPVKTRVCPIVREPDGLAMSSRNRYLSIPQRKQACVIYQSLCYARRMVKEGKREANLIIRAIRRQLTAGGIKRIDYVECVHPDTLQPLSRVKRKALLAVAARIGRTRLIDNIMVSTR